MKKNKKVAIFHCGFIYSGGGERLVLEQSKGLTARGYKVSVFAPTLDRKKCFPELINEVSVNTFFPSLIDKIPYRNAMRMILTSLFAPLFALKFLDTEIFIGANQPGAWMAYCIAKTLKRPYLVYLNQPNRIIYPRPIDLKYGWKSTVNDYQVLYKLFRYFKPIIAYLDRISIQKANKLLVGGSYMVGIIQNVYSTLGDDVPAGAYYQPKSQILSAKNIYQGIIRINDSRIRKPYLLITNRHDPQKRFDYVIDAFSLVLKKFPHASLVISGPYTNHTKTLIAQIKKLKLERKIHLLGQVAEEDLLLLYKNACVYCYPSPQEDFGLGPLEAGGSGIPTVAWNNAGPTVTVENGVTGFLANPFDVNDYAAKILKLLQNPGLRTKMGKAAWERTKNKFSWKRHNDLLEKALLESMRAKAV